jgi:hypothetical protein
MLRDKKLFTGGTNQDDSLHLLDDAQYLRLMNGRVGVTQYGKNYRVEGVPGTTSITQSVYPPYGTNICIGSCIDIEGQRLLWFVYNTFSDHGIYAFDFAASTTYAVLYDSQVEGGLNFDKNHRIDKNCKVNQGLLYWTDNYNEPKKINIDSGIKLNYPSYNTDARAYTTLTDSYEIMLIRRPPVYAPSIEKLYNNTFINNFIANRSWLFAWQYVYFDGEESVIGEYSVASMLNLVELGVPELYNHIYCTLNLLEKIPQTARIIRLVAKDELTNSANVIKTFDKLIDEQPFIAHNSGATQLSFDYYGDVTGVTIPSSIASKPFDSVPLLSTTMESATNRIFLANNLSGYDTPTTTSLAVTQTTAIAGANKRFFKSESSYQLGIAFYDKARRKCGVVTKNDNITTTPPKVFTPNSNFNVIPIIANYDFAVDNNFEFDVVQLGNFTASGGAPGNGTAFTATSSFTANMSVNIIGNVTALSPGFTVFRIRIIKNYGLPAIAEQFFDTASMGLPYYFNSTLTLNNYAITIGDVFQVQFISAGICELECYGGSPFTIASSSTASSNVLTLNWALNNNNKLNEIPSWAYYYSILRTGNLKTRYFIDSYSSTNKYASKNVTVTSPNFATYTYSDTWNATTTNAIAIDTTILLQSGLGYNYTEGDICVLVNSSSVRYELPIIGQDGAYILLKSAYLVPNLANIPYIYEIYTPYIRGENEPFYEVGNTYPITNAGTVNRQYSTLSGNLIGDVFVFQRQFNSSIYYYVEAMSPNDLFYKNWFTDEGFANFVILLGQNRNEHEIRYSNAYAAGTQSNGLSTFEALNYKAVPLGTGSIQKLQLASKTTEQGVVMLSIGSFQTASCYLGEVQLVGASANSSIIADTSVIGTVNVLKGMFGTTAPETVVEYLGVIFWYDLNNGTIVQYSSNGLFPVSSYKQEKLFKNYAKEYLAASSGNLDNINGFHHIPTYVDPYHKELGVTLPGLIYENYADTLPSYSSVPSYASSIINRFDMSDGLAKTVTFNIQENKWISDYQFTAEQYDYFENRMFGWKNGALYEFNTNSSLWNTWFGQQYPVRICWVLNKPLSGLKDMAEIVIEGSQAPNFTVIYTTLPNTQITDLTSSDFTNQEGILYARILRDRLSPNTTGTADQKLNTGDVVLSQIPQIMTEFQSYESIIYVNFVDVGFNLSRGQNFILGNQ